MSETSRVANLCFWYERYLEDENSAAFIEAATRRYTLGTLERLAVTGERMARRASVLLLGFVADYEANHTLGRALSDADRGVRLIAENSIRHVWFRIGTEAQRQTLLRLALFNDAQQYADAESQATPLLKEAPWIAEAWNQRAIARFRQENLPGAVLDCHETLEINPYHFGAAAGMGQCLVRQGCYTQALDAFRRALRLNPGLEGVRSVVRSLERALKDS